MKYVGFRANKSSNIKDLPGAEAILVADAIPGAAASEVEWAIRLLLIVDPSIGCARCWVTGLLKTGLVESPS